MFIPIWLVIILILFIPGALELVFSVGMFVLGGAAALAALVGTFYLIVVILQSTK